MSWVSWLIWGFAATVVLTTIAEAGQGLRLTRMSIPYLLGTMVTPNRDRAKVWGVLLHAVNGLVFAFLYFAIFSTMREVPWWSGAVLGFVHAAFVLVVGLTFLPGVHPRMSRPTQGPTTVRQLEPPGFLAMNYGMQTPITVVVSHVAYGLVLSVFYGLPA